MSGAGRTRATTRRSAAAVAASAAAAGPSSIRKSSKNKTNEGTQPAEGDNQKEDDQESGGDVGLEEEEEEDDDEQDDDVDCEKPESIASARGDEDNSKKTNKKDAPVVATRRSARARRKPNKRGFSSDTSVDSENNNKSLKQNANSTKEKRRRSNEDDKDKSSKKTKGSKGNKVVENNNDEDDDSGGGDPDHENESGMEQKTVVAATRNKRKKSDVKKTKRSSDDTGNDDESSDSDEDAKTRGKRKKDDHVGNTNKKSTKRNDEEDGDEDSDDNLSEREKEANAADEGDMLLSDKDKERELGHLMKNGSGGEESAKKSTTDDDEEDDKDDDKPIKATIKRKRPQQQLQQQQQHHPDPTASRKVSSAMSKYKGDSNNSDPTSANAKVRKSTRIRSKSLDVGTKEQTQQQQPEPTDCSDSNNSPVSDIDDQGDDGSSSIEAIEDRTGGSNSSLCDDINDDSPVVEQQSTSSQDKKDLPREPQDARYDKTSTRTSTKAQKVSTSVAEPEPTNSQKLHGAGPGKGVDTDSIDLHPKDQSTITTLVSKISTTTKTTKSVKIEAKKPPESSKSAKEVERVAPESTATGKDVNESKAKKEKEMTEEHEPVFYEAVGDIDEEAEEDDEDEDDQVEEKVDSKNGTASGATVDDVHTEVLTPKVEEQCSSPANTPEQPGWQRSDPNFSGGGNESETSRATSTTSTKRRSKRERDRTIYNPNNESSSIDMNSQTKIEESAPLHERKNDTSVLSMPVQYDSSSKNVQGVFSVSSVSKDSMQDLERIPKSVGQDNACEIQVDSDAKPGLKETTTALDDDRVEGSTREVEEKEVSVADVPAHAFDSKPESSKKVVSTITSLTSHDQKGHNGSSSVSNNKSYKSDANFRAATEISSTMESDTLCNEEVGITNDRKTGDSTTDEKLYAIHEISHGTKVDIQKDQLADTRTVGLVETLQLSIGGHAIRKQDETVERGDNLQSANEVNSKRNAEVEPSSNYCDAIMQGSEVDSSVSVQDVQMGESGLCEAKKTDETSVEVDGSPKVVPLLLGKRVASEGEHINKQSMIKELQVDSSESVSHNSTTEENPKAQRVDAISTSTLLQEITSNPSLINLNLARETNTCNDEAILSETNACQSIYLSTDDKSAQSGGNRTTKPFETSSEVKLGIEVCGKDVGVLETTISAEGAETDGALSNEKDVELNNATMQREAMPSIKGKLISAVKGEPIPAAEGEIIPAVNRETISVVKEEPTESGGAGSELCERKQFGLSQDIVTSDENTLSSSLDHSTSLVHVSGLIKYDTPILSETEIKLEPLQFNDDMINLDRTGFTDDGHGTEDQTKTNSSDQQSFALKKSRINLDQIKLVLFAAGKGVHRCPGYEGLFSEYWDALSLRIEGNLSSYQMKGCRSTLDSFLKTKGLKKLHNKLIMGLLARCLEPITPFQEVASVIPVNWQSRIKILKPVGVKEIDDDDLFTPEEKEGPYSLSAKVQYCTPILKEIQPTCARSFAEMPKSALKIPGALIVDPLVRALAQGAGLSVSENAIWVLVIAIKEYTKSLLNKSINFIKEIEDEQKPARSRSQIAALDKKRAVSLSVILKEKSASQPNIITARHIHALTASMPTGAARSLSSRVSRITFERSLHASNEHCLNTAKEEFAEVKNFVACSVMTQPSKSRKMDLERKIGTGTSKYMPAAPSPSTLSSNLASPVLVPAPVASSASASLPGIGSITAPGLDKVSLPASAPQPTDQSRIPSHTTTIPAASTIAPQAQSSVNIAASTAPKPGSSVPVDATRPKSPIRGGLGRGAKDLASLFARSKSVVAGVAEGMPGGKPETASPAPELSQASEPARDARPVPISSQNSSPMHGRDPLSSRTAASDKNAEVPSNNPEDDPDDHAETALGSTLRRGKGFGVKNLAAMKARALSEKPEDN